MEDFEVIKKFISESEFSDEIKDALLQAISLENLGRPVSDYSALVRKIADRGHFEN